MQKKKKRLGMKYWLSEGNKGSSEEQYGWNSIKMRALHCRGKLLSQKLSLRKKSIWNPSYYRSYIHLGFLPSNLLGSRVDYAIVVAIVFPSFGSKVGLKKQTVPLAFVSSIFFRFFICFWLLLHITILNLSEISKLQS